MSESAGRPATRGRRVTRRALIGLVLVAQLSAVVLAYDNDHRQFGFQMFPEASRWKADIVRVEADGSRVPLEDGWEYRWSELVQGRGLTNPARWHHADAGLRGQIAFFEAALDWVAANTPDDTTTRYLEAEISYLDNGRGPTTITVRTPDRRPG